ncbi:PAS domain-containing sensor histidine kinase [Massilia sp. AB1]|uniref:PAS domain-containing sensor histidine kinase n=1 Tax=Massilia sp. AB1 TaxID=2823371 RepID=UPI001B81C253|nr:PAS domain-containing sensor histidine kinase [Massilia sp. AB1]MBQ5941671.1 PAS domain S-box protein [Massilia sp. AB1]
MPTDPTRPDACWTQRDADAFSELMLVKTRQYGVMFYDTELRITGWNQGAAFITGWTADEVIGKTTAILFVPEDRERKLDEHEAQTAALVGVGEDERWHLRRDGSCFWASGVSVPLHRDENGRVTGFVKIFRDATHLRARTRYLENELKENVSRQAERDVFIGTIAHEMRNPLSPLRSAQQLLQMFSGDAERSRQPLAVIDRQLGFLEKLIEDLVDLTRVQSGKMSIAYEKTHLQVLLSEAIESCRGLAHAQQISFHLSFPAVPIEIEVDSRRINQIFVNLINNAIKYNHPGGDVWLTATADQTHFVCYLKDNGKGIPAEIQPRIFDVFTQAEGTDAQRGAGLGIGLAVVRELVSLHQGTVEVRSEGVGKGSEFIVRIPLRRPA